MKTKIVTMTIEELKRVEIIQQVEDGKKTVLQSSRELQLSVRQTRRLIKTYRMKGAAGLAHSNRGKAPPSVGGHVLSLNYREIRWGYWLKFVGAISCYLLGVRGAKHLWV